MGSILNKKLGCVSKLICSKWYMAMSPKLPVNGFKWVEEEKLSEFDKRFIKNYDEDADEGYFLEVDVEYPKDLSNSHKDLPSLPEWQRKN